MPYYRERFEAAGVAPGDIRDVGDLRAIPPSTRVELRAAGDALFARGFDPERALEGRTSGSSGRPWSIYRTPMENRLRRALELRSMRAAGVRADDLTATLGPLRAPTVGVLARLGRFRNEYLSIRLPVEEQAARLRALRPSVLWIYPSALRPLLQYAGSLAAVCAPRLLIFSAEELDPILRARVVDGGGPELRNFYGAVETGRIAWECAAGAGLHVNADCLIVEIGDEEAPGAGGPVIVTNLHSRGMPLVRYRLGDRLRWIEGPCPCGVALPRVAPPAGREWDLIVLPSGRLSPPLAVTTYLSAVRELRQYRVVQKRRDHLVFHFVCDPAPSAGTLDDLRQQLARHLGEPMTLDFELVERIEPIAGKERVYVSELERPPEPAV